jgi:glutamine synthetase
MAYLMHEKDVSIDTLMSHIQTSSVQLVRFLFCDTSSIIRGKTTHVERLRSRLKQGIGLVKGTMAMNILDALQTDTGYGATGEIRIVPDPDTFAILPYAPHSAAILCDLVELDHTPWSLCPRSILKRQIERAAEMNIRIEAAFEPEFMLGTSSESGEFKPIDEGLCFSTESMNKAAGFTSAFVAALQAQSLQVEQYYPELGPGQHELSITHAPALQCADRHILYRETLRGVAHQMGMVASLAPKPFADLPGNGNHLHVSAWDIVTGKNLFYDAREKHAFSELGRWFVAGLVKHLPALVALTCASVNSYRRLKPKSWSSAFTCWGYENREAAVRVPTTYWGNEEGSTNVEIKCVDSSCNPYLALAAVIAAGIDGIKRQLEPPEPCDVDPSTLSPEEASRYGIKRLPSTLKDALRKLLSDAVLMEALGIDMAKTYITVKTSEVVAFSKQSVEFELENHRTKF